MRRHSPPRRHRSPPSKRRPRGRSMSPLSRSQPAPPGEERDRKMGQWEAPGNRNKRFRSRSRSREWNGRAPNREPPVINLEGPQVRGRGRRIKEHSRERRDRDREVQIGRDIELKDHRMQQGFEESYLDHQPLIFESNMGTPRHDTIIQEPSMMVFNSFGQDHRSQEKTTDMSERTLHVEPPPREHRRSSPDFRHGASPNFYRGRSPIHGSERVNSPIRGSQRGSSPIRGSKTGSHHINSPARRGQRGNSPIRGSQKEKVESEKDRLIRLEKLVEKLVEGKASSPAKLRHSISQSDKRIPELIPSNTKFTVSMWLNSVHEECLRRNYDEKSSIRFMQDQMSGIIKAWFKTVSNYDFTWPELKLLITRTFPDNIEFAQTLKILVMRDKNPEETLTQYYFSKLYLCDACKITGENAVSCLIDGLNNPFMKQNIKQQNFLTPESLYSEYLAKCPENEPSITMGRREVREVVMPDFQPPDEYIPLNMEIMPEPPRRESVMSHREPVLTYPQHGEEKNNKRCYTCNKFGHRAIDCRHAPICYKCKKKGHIAVKCTFRSNNINLIKSTSGKIQTKKCFINGQEYSGIVDTGSEVITVRKQVIQELGLGLMSSTEKLSGFGGRGVKPLGEVEVLLSVDEVGRSVRALVVEDDMQCEAVIVGQEYLSLKGVVLYQQGGQAMLFDHQ